MSGNLFAKLKALLPDAPLQTGTVLANDAGMCIVEMPGGAQVNVRGEYAAGARVFFRAGVVESTAPNLPLVAVDI